MFSIEEECEPENASKSIFQCFIISDPLPYHQAGISKVTALTLLFCTAQWSEPEYQNSRNCSAKQQPNYEMHLKRFAILKSHSLKELEHSE